MSESDSRFDADEPSRPPFQARVPAETIQRVVETVYALVDECRIHLGQDGIEILAVDPATVASVTLDVDAAAFDSYDASGDRIGVNLERLGDLVGMADRDQAVQFTLDAGTRMLDVEIGELEYSMALIDPEAIRAPPESATLDFDFSAGVVLEPAAVDRAIRSADMVANHLAIGVDEADGAFYVEAEGDTDDVSLSLPEAELVDFTPGRAHSLFSLDYLKDINRALPSDAELRLRLGTEIPLAIDYEIAGGDGSVEYLLSPRIAAS